MSGNFDWKTEEDFDWDNLAEESSVEDRPPKKSRRILAVLLILVLLGSLAVLAWRTIGSRVDENTQAMRSDIISSHSLLQFAEAEQDDELFFSLLSGRDSDWTAAQHKLFQARSLRNRTPFGLQALPDQSPPPEEDDTLSINFSPDLLAAEVETVLPYRIEIGNGLSEEVLLRETAVYRLGRERWLLAPPDQEFWGEQESQRGSRIELTYPGRDAEIAERLLVDLERKLDEACTAIADLECAPGLWLDVELSKDPLALVNAAYPYAATPAGSGLSISLPTPTQVGLPQDETGYQALFRGYAAQVIAAVLSHGLEYDCCGQLPLYQALLDYQLSLLALKPWPVEDKDYARVAQESVTLQELTPLWHSDDPHYLSGPEGWRIYLVIDYFMSNLPDVEPMQVQKELVAANGFYSWLNSLFAEEHGLTSSALFSKLMRGLWLRGYGQNLPQDSDLLAGAPAQDLYLTCAAPRTLDDDERITTLYRYDFSSGSWDNTYETTSLLWIASLPGNDLLLRQEYNNDGSLWNTEIQQNAQLLPLNPDPAEYTISFGQTDPDSNGLAAFVFNADSEEATITWFDLQNCLPAGGCANVEFPGIPIWSPDGSRALFSSDPGAQIALLQTDQRTILYDPRAPNAAIPIFLASRSQLLDAEPVRDAESLTQVGSGHAPFWLDDETFGYVSSGREPNRRRASAVMLSTLGQDDPQVLFTLEELVAEIESDLNAQRLYWIQYVMVHPDNPDLFFAVVLSELQERADVFSFDRAAGEVRHLMSAGFPGNHSLSISPHGRYVLLTGEDEGDPDSGQQTTLLQVYDLESQQTSRLLTLTASFPPFVTYDWSDDGSWLVLLPDDNKLAFFAPEQQLFQTIAAPPGDCDSPVLINRQ